MPESSVVSDQEVWASQARTLLCVVSLLPNDLSLLGLFMLQGRQGVNSLSQERVGGRDGM